MTWFHAQAHHLLERLRHVLFPPVDVEREWANVVHLEPGPGSTVFAVATDGSRLTRVTLTWSVECQQPEAGFTITRNDLVSITQRLRALSRSSVEVGFDDGSLHIGTDESHVRIPVQSRAYIEYRRVLPAENEYRRGVILPKKQLVAASRCACTVSTKGSFLLEYRPPSCNIWFVDDTGAMYTVAFGAQPHPGLADEPFAIRCKARHLRDAVEHCVGDEVMICLGEAQKPVLVAGRCFNPLHWIAVET